MDTATYYRPGRSWAYTGLTCITGVVVLANRPPSPILWGLGLASSAAIGLLVVGLTVRLRPGVGLAVANLPFLAFGLPLAVILATTYVGVASDSGDSRSFAGRSEVLVSITLIVLFALQLWWEHRNLLRYGRLALGLAALSAVIVGDFGVTVVFSTPEAAIAIACGAAACTFALTLTTSRSQYTALGASRVSMPEAKALLPFAAGAGVVIALIATFALADAIVRYPH